MLKLADGPTAGAFSFSKPKIQFRLFAGWKLVLEKEPEQPQDNLFVSFQEYSRLEECTKNPAPPPEAVLRGAALLDKLRNR